MNDFERFVCLLKKNIVDQSVEITPDTNLFTDLGLNSYDIAQIIADVEDEFDLDADISMRQMHTLKRVSDVMGYLEHHT